MLSVIVICKNEEAHIARCLKSVDFADEIIVLDSGSTDNTVQIAKKYTSHVYLADWQGYGVQKQRALVKATRQWVLNLDADEFLSDSLRQKIQQIIAEDHFDAYRVPIKMHFYNKALNYSSSPKRHVRLFKREGAAFSDDIVHEKIILPQSAKIGRLRQPILHYSFKDVSHFLYKMNKYSSYSAKIRIEKQKKSSLTHAIFSSFWMFFRSYVLQRGFLDGNEGFLMAVFNAHGAFYRGVKHRYKDESLDKLPDVTTQERE